MAPAFCGFTRAIRDTVQEVSQTVHTSFTRFRIEYLCEKLSLHLLLLCAFFILLRVTAGERRCVHSARQRCRHSRATCSVNTLSLDVPFIPPGALPRSSARRARRMASNSGSLITVTAREQVTTGLARMSSCGGWFRWPRCTVDVTQQARCRHVLGLSSRHVRWKLDVRSKRCCGRRLIRSRKRKGATPTHSPVFFSSALVAFCGPLF